jgi:hypothetical protein
VHLDLGERAPAIAPRGADRAYFFTETGAR